MNFEINAAESVSSISNEDIRALLDKSFPGMFTARSYFKQEPHSRLLAHNDNELLGYVGIEKRVVNVAGEIIPIVGVIDLCVVEHYRSMGIGSALVHAIEAKFSDRDFAILMADNPALYLKLNYVSLNPAPTRWLAIDELKSHSIVERDLGDCFMVKPLGHKKWPAGAIDLLGYLF